MLSPTVGNICWMFEKKELRHWISEVSGNTFSSRFLGFWNQSKARGFRPRVVAPIPPPLPLRPDSTFTHFTLWRESSAPTALCCLRFLVLPHLSSWHSVSIMLCFLSQRYYLPIASPFISLALCQLNQGLSRHFWRLCIGLSAIYLWTVICYKWVCLCQLWLKLSKIFPL